MNGSASTPTVGRSSAPDRLAAAALVLAAVSASVGLFASGIYRDSDAWVRQARAADLVTLMLVVPVLAAALWRARAGSDAGRLVALAALGYLVYNYAIFGFSVTINPMTPVHIAVLGLSVWALVLGIVSVARTPLAPSTADRVPRRTTTIFLVLVALLFGSLWAGQIADAVTSGVLPAAVADLGLTTNPVYTLDLAFALPFLVVAGVALYQGSAIGRETAAAAVVWTAMMGVGVLAIFVFDAAAGAEVEPAIAAVIATITAIALLLSVASLTPRLSHSRMDAGRMPA